MKNSVLFVDDEVHILGSLRRAVIDENYVAYFASSAQEALAFMDKTPIHVIVTDMRMPGMDGLTMLRIAKEYHPEMIRIVLSGYTQLSQVLAAINEGDIHKYITKPWEMEDLLLTIREAIELYNLRKEKEELTKALEQRNTAYKNVFKMIDIKLHYIEIDYTTIKELFSFAFTNAKSTCMQPNVVAVYETLCLDFLNAVPSYPIGFELQQISEQLTAIMEKTLPDKNNLVLDLGKDKCSGNFRLLLFLFNVLVLLRKYEFVTFSKCKLTSKSDTTTKKVLLQGTITLTITSSAVAPLLQRLKDLAAKYQYTVRILDVKGLTIFAIETEFDIVS